MVTQATQLSTNLIPLREVGNLLRASRPTVLRWATEGIRGTRLEMLRVGTRYYSTSEAIESFLQSQQQEPAK